MEKRGHSRHATIVAKPSHTPEKIINKMREAEVLLSQGETIDIASRKIGISDHTYYRWRKEYGGMTVNQAHRLKELEQDENAFGLQAS